MKDHIEGATVGRGKSVPPAPKKVRREGLPPHLPRWDSFFGLQWGHPGAARRGAALRHKGMERYMY
jgi:hypothetical protein